MRIILPFIILISFRLNAQSVVSARQNGMANAATALTDIGSVYANQAGLVSIQKPTLALNYEKPFSGQAISSASAIFAFPYKKQVWAINFNRYGLDSYRDEQLGLACAREFSPNLSAALAFQYHQLSIENYGHSQAFAIDAGLRYQLSKYLNLGTHISNLNKSELNRELLYSDVPVIVQFGAAYQSTEQLLLALTFEQTLGLNTDLKFGMEYQLMAALALRGGFSVHPFREYAGLGLVRQSFKLDFGFASHQVLGYATQIGLSYAF